VHQFADLPISDYVLEVKSLGGKPFQETVSLDMNIRSTSVLIQTDKAIYKPSDKVQFRVLFIDGETLPQAPENVTISITDGEQNKVKQYTNVTLTKGVFESAFQLSELAILGGWTINVKIDDDYVDYYQKSFTVEKYVLPTFSWKIETDPVVNFNEEEIKVKAVGTYVSGKKLKGQVTIYAQSDYYYIYPPSVNGAYESKDLILVNGATVSKIADINGKPVIFDIAKELLITDRKTLRGVTFTATYIDKDLGKKETSVRVLITSMTYTLNSQVEKDFKPSLPFTITAIVQNKDLPVTDRVNPVVFNITGYTDKIRNCGFTPNAYRCVQKLPTYKKIFKTYPVNGMAKLEIITPINIDRLEIKYNFTNVASQTRFINSRETRDKENLQIKLLTEK
jgi:CD109 antigen